MAAPAPPRRPYRLIALDLDGTLLDDAGRVSPADGDALRRFRASGGIVVLASGRMTSNIRPVYDELGIDGPTIAYGGAVTRDAREAGAGVVLETPLPARYADELIEYTARERLHLNYYLDETLWARDVPELRRYADWYSRQTGAVFEFVPDLERFLGREPSKLVIVTDPTDSTASHPRSRDELYRVWERRWGDEVTLMKTNPEYLEFYHQEVNKGRAVAVLARHCGVPPALTIAIGDNLNDISMLEAAGCGVAVANANEEVRAAADWVSPLSNNESAVADAIARLVEGVG